MGAKPLKYNGQKKESGENTEHINLFPQYQEQQTLKGVGRGVGGGETPQAVAGPRLTTLNDRKQVWHDTDCDATKQMQVSMLTEYNDVCKLSGQLQTALLKSSRSLHN